MPELPEVETIARRLSTVLPGKKILKITVLRVKSFVGVPEDVIGTTITKISRRSKILRLHLDNSQNILIHLKMTGQLIYQDENHRLGGGHPSADWVQELPNKHTRVVVELSDKATLFFNDLRVFGWLKVMDDDAVAKEYAPLGPDIIDEVVTVEYLKNALKKRGIPIKLAVMDNAIAAGVGNIYANDALNMARLDPFRPAHSLNEDEIAQLHRALKTVIKRGIDLGGATIDNFRDIDGFAGKYQEKVLVYGKGGEACQNCAGIIVRKKQAGRSTFYCLKCQK